MGQQQLLIIILGVIIIGIAVAVGIIMFDDDAVSSNRDAMSTDLTHLAAKAMHYYGRPTSMGGGGHSFVGISMDRIVNSTFADNINGIYSITSVTPDSVKFQGVGKVVGGGRDSTRLVMTVSRSGAINIIEIPQP